MGEYFAFIVPIGITVVFMVNRRADDRAAKRDRRIVRELRQR